MNKQGKISLGLMATWGALFFFNKSIGNVRNMTISAGFFLLNLTILALLIWKDNLS